MDSKPAPDPKEEVLGVDVSVSVWEAERERGEQAISNTLAFSQACNR